MCLRISATDLGDAVEVGHLIEQAVHGAFAARAVVADDVEDERVVQLAEVLDGLDDAADLEVGILAEAGEDLHLAGEEPLLVGTERVPVLDGLGLGGELGAGGDDAELDLAGQRLLAELVPALVELALVLGDPLLRHVVRGVRGTRGEVGEERLVRRQRLLGVRPLDRLVGEVGHEVVVRVLRHLDAGHVLVDRRGPLVRLAADEAVELVEAGAGRPAVGRAGGADLPGGGLVRLAEGGRAVAVEPQHLGQRGHAVRALPGLAGEGGGGLGDRAHVADVMVAAGQQGRAGRRAERRGVELVVAQPALGHPLQRRHVDRPAEGAGLAEAHVVDQHDEHVRGLGRRLDLEPRRGLGVAGVERRDRRELRLGDRQDRAVELVRLLIVDGGVRLRVRGLREAGSWFAGRRRMAERHAPGEGEDRQPCHRSLHDGKLLDGVG